MTNLPRREKMKRTVSGIMSMLLSVGMLMLAFNIQPVKAEGTIYIRADGTFDPPTAPIQRDGNIYTLTGNITSDSDGIIIERNNVTLDGAGYTVQGTVSDVSMGIGVSGNNVTIKNVEIATFGYGVFLIGSSNSVSGNTIMYSKQDGIRGISSSNNSITGNQIISSNHDGIGLWGSSNYNSIAYNSITANNYDGIFLQDSSDNNIVRNSITANGAWVGGDGIDIVASSNISIYGNIIANNWRAGIYLGLSSNDRIAGNSITANTQYGIELYSSSNNVVYHNNFVNNNNQVYIWTPPSANYWDDGYPSGGSYWSDYIGVDGNGDGIGDTPYIIDVNNQDRYPLMNPWSQTPVNRPPSIPSTPMGPNVFKKGVSKSFASSATDPDGNDLSITFSWGDGTQTTVGPESSGAVFDCSHTWSYAGMYEVKAKATDIHGAESDLSSSFEVTVLTDYPPNEKWAGYFADLSNSLVVTLSVEGQWIQSSYGSVMFWSQQGTWVGIGGVGESSNLLQAGICVRDFLFHRDVVPFYEAIGPGQDTKVIGWGYAASPGDLIETKIIMIGYNRWQISVKDITKDWIWMPSAVSYSPDLTKADWVHEPGAGGAPAVSFSPVHFTQARLIVNYVTYKIGSMNPSLNAELYQRNYRRDTTPLTAVSALSGYEKFTISDTGIQSTAVESGGLISLHSSADLNIYDSMGNHLGHNPTTGVIDAQIPNSTYFEDESGAQYAWLFQQGAYHINLVGTATGKYALTVEYITPTQDSTQTFSGTISAQETKYYYALFSENGQMTAISWEYVYTDIKRGTVLKISTEDKLFQFVAPGKDFGIKHDSNMKVLNHVIIICYEDSKMRLAATAVDDKIGFCSAVAWDKQRRKFYFLVDEPNCT
jgi:parallel beta-helix repeat protein